MSIPTITRIPNKAQVELAVFIRNRGPLHACSPMGVIITLTPAQGTPPLQGT